MARSVEDAPRLFEVVAGYDQRNVTIVGQSRCRLHQRSSLRVPPGVNLSAMDPTALESHAGPAAWRGIAAYAPDDAELHRLQRSLPSELIQPARTWREFKRAAAAASCVIVAVPRLDVDLAVRIVAFRADMPLKPVVLVTASERGSAYWLGRISVDELIWTDEIENRLQNAVRGVCERNVLSRIAGLFERSTLPDPLRRALAQACRAAVPTGVEQLAADAGTNRGTLARQWRFARPDPDITLERILGWLLLIHALKRRAAGTKWSAIARELGVATSTLERTAPRIAGCTLSEVEAEGLSALVERFMQRVVRPLVASNEKLA
jgi:hypothetical protein